MSEKLIRYEFDEHGDPVAIAGGEWVRWVDVKDQREGWQPIETAPKDSPILAYCNHEADTGCDESGRRLTLYAAHYEGLSHTGTGIRIVEWGGGWADSGEDGGGWLPDWWFVVESEFEVAANPTHWMPLPAEPGAQS